MEDFSKDGRKLRPRKRISQSGPAYSTEHKDFGSDGHRQGFGGRPGAGEHRPGAGNRRQGTGERRSYQGQPENGERRSYQGRHGASDRFGSDGHRPGFGGRPGAGDRRNGNGRRFQGDSRPGKGFHTATGRKPYSRKAPGGFSKASEEGIDRMIAKSPVPRAQSDFDYTGSGIKEEIRLNKFIANSGVCSRREADTMIQAGVVSVNDVVVTELGTKVNVLKDVVKFNGETLRGEAKVYIVMNKPKGYVTTASDPHADKTVMDLLKGCTTRVYPVGRLDKATTGVLMFTNDGEISERLTHPSYDKKKIYQVLLNKPLSEEDRDRILSGIELSDGPIAADALEFIDPEDHRKLGIEIHSGKNRIVRRIFETTGYDVRTLDRVYFAGLTKRGLKKGEWRYLTEGEVNILKMGAYV